MEPTPEMIAEMEMQVAVDEIIRNAEIERRGGEDCVYFFVLRYGSKNLEVYYHPELNYIDNSIEGEENLEKKPRETEALYRAAKKIIQEEIVDNAQKELPFIYETSNQKMVLFAQHKGREIFEWDKEKEAHVEDKNGENKTFWKFAKTFKPQEKL